jgi:probable selenium-dependent hydroxylase accessory protein YqeC
MAYFYRWREKEDRRKYGNEEGCSVDARYRQEVCAGWAAVAPGEAFPFIKERGHVVSLVGAGGKTSLMYSLANQCAAEGGRVLVSTTTHIRKPLDGTYIKTTEELLAQWNKNQIAVAGLECAKGKISMPPSICLEKWMPMADIVFLEADGSKRLPLKVPAEKEPVILEACDIVIAVAGLSALGKPLERACFRLAHAEALLGKSGKDAIAEADFAKVLTSESGNRKNVESREYYMVLNQCDGENELVQAKLIAQNIKPEDRSRIYAACLRR